MNMYPSPLQDVDVLAVLDFQIPCSSPESPGFCLRYLLTKHEGHGRKLGVRDDCADRKEGLKEPGWRGRRRPEELCS